LNPLHTIGILLRDETQPFPLEQMQIIFDRMGVKMFVLNHDRPDHPLDLVIAMGGDGTVLRALDEFPDQPVLAVNFGLVGFLTAGDRSDLEKLLFRVLAGDYLVSERLILSCSYPGGKAHAVNEMVIKSGSRMIMVDVWVNGAKIRTIRGDGVILGTPTGSTGYLLSTGSPVVMPDVNCFVLDGINEYNFSSRPLILSPETQVRFYLHPPVAPQDVRFIIDGKPVAMLTGGNEILCKRSHRRARLIFFEENYFFHNLSSRLSWN